MTNFLSQVLSEVPASHSVTYSCTFQNNWSGVNHPFEYPSNAHWSPPVIAAHSKRYTMWKPGEEASEGVENVAETGSTSTLEDELDDAQAEDSVGEFITGSAQFNSDTQEQTFADIAMTPWFNMMSSITMVAPSPDWYSGFYKVNPINKSSMVWYESFVIASYPWDAGTEEGDTFSGSNSAQNPKAPIMQLTKDTVPDNGVFLNSEETEVLPMATWSCTLKTSLCTNHDAVEYRGRARRNCNWVARNKTGRKCRKKHKGQPLSVWCPEACGECDIIAA